jgi:hypothetical protein
MLRTQSLSSSRLFQVGIKIENMGSKGIKDHEGWILLHKAALRLTNSEGAFDGR